MFAVKSKKAKKTNLSVRFLGESMACQSGFWFYLTFNFASTFRLCLTQKILRLHPCVSIMLLYSSESKKRKKNVKLSQKLSVEENGKTFASLYKHISALLIDRRLTFESCCSKPILQKIRQTSNVPENM